MLRLGAMALLAVAAIVVGYALSRFHARYNPLVGIPAVVEMFVLLEVPRPRPCSPGRAC
jgi:hypothetical protein